MGMNIVTYFNNLNQNERDAFASRAGTTSGYLRAHVLGKKSGFRKRPSNELIVGLVAASEGNVSLKEAIDYFLVEPVLKLAVGVGVAQPSQDCAAPLLLEANPPRRGTTMKGFDSADKGMSGGYGQVGVGL